MVKANEFPPPGRPRVHPATTALRQLVDTTREFESFLQKELAVNKTDLDAMQHLIARGPLTAKELARSINHSPGGTTAVIDRLEEAGHVRREPDPSDRRVIRIAATAASRERAEDILWRMIESVDGVAWSMSPDEQEIVVSYLNRVNGLYLKHSRGVDPSSG